MAYYRKIALLLILIPIIAGATASLLFRDIIEEDFWTHEKGNYTELYIINNNNMPIEKSISSGSSVSYTATIENYENKSMTYELKTILEGNVVYDENIQLNNSATINKTLSFNPEIFNLTIPVAKLEFLLYRNGELYRSIVSQLVIHDISNDKSNDNKSIAENKTNNKTNSTKIINESKFVETYKKLEYLDNTTYIFNTGEILEINTSNNISNDTLNNTSNKTISSNDITYRTTSVGKDIIFIGDMYEKILPNKLNYLYPVIENITNKTLKVNETLYLKNNYSITITQIDDITKTIRLKISKNNVTVRDIINQGNSSIEYWVDINEYKKQKVLQIIPETISKDNVVFDVNQYGIKRLIFVGNNYGEFTIANITEDSIILKNTQPLEIETGKVLKLMNGRIKIKV